MAGSTMLTIQEWSTLAKSLRAAYPQQSFLADEYSIKLYYSMLKDLNYEVLSIAVQNYILREHFPPTVADLRKMAVDATSPVALDWSEGYREVQNAIRRYGYMREAEALNSMSDVTAETVRRIGWQNLCMSDPANEMTDRANFRNVFQTIEKRNREQAVLPVGFREKIKSIRQRGVLLIE